MNNEIVHGEKYSNELSTSDIAKLIKQEFKNLQKNGAIAKHFNLSMRKSNTGLDASIKVNSYLDISDRTECPSDAPSVVQAIELVNKIADQYRFRQATSSPGVTLTNFHLYCHLDKDIDFKWAAAMIAAR
jgi:hypothetical protein